MSTKPETSPEEAARETAKATPPGKSALSGKSSAKPASTIDLPAEAVSQIEEAAAPHQASPEQKPRTPMLVPALCGLIAGLAGSAGLFQFMSAKGPTAQLETRLLAIETKTANPALPQAVADRLKSAETALTEITTRETTLRGEIDQLARALRSEGETRAQGIAALAARPAEVNPTPNSAASLNSAPASPEIETLRNRLGAIDQTLRALPDAIGAVGARSEAASGKVEALSPRIDQLSTRIEQIQPRIGALSEQVSALARSATGTNRQDALARATAFVIASAAVNDLFRGKKPYEAALGPLAALGADAQMLAPLQPFAKSGAPDASVLLAEIKALRVKPAATAPASNDIVERFKAGALAMIEVRRTGEITGTDDEAHLARIEQALQRSELALASGLLDKLSADRKPAFTAFAERLKARISAEAGLERVRATAQSALSEAAQALAK